MYHGITGFEVSIAPQNTNRPELQDVLPVVGTGTMVAFGHSKMFGTQLNGDGRIRTYAWFRGPVDPSSTRTGLLTYVSSLRVAIPEPYIRASSTTS